MIKYKYLDALQDKKLKFVKIIAETDNFIIMLVMNEIINEIGICNYCKYSTAMYYHTKDEYFRDIGDFRYKDEITNAFLSSELYKTMNLLS